jgi:two-component system, cell cycle response regulator DivK
VSTHILVIDDNPLNLKLASHVLTAAGMSVSQALDAEQAEVALESELPNLVLMDLALPGMDGLTLARKLRQDQRFEHMPIIALTAFAMKGDDRKALEAGCDGYISKPIDTRTFASTVQGFLGARRDRGAAQ